MGPRRNTTPALFATTRSLPSRNHPTTLLTPRPTLSIRLSKPRLVRVQPCQHDFPYLPESTRIDRPSLTFSRQHVPTALLNSPRPTPKRLPWTYRYYACQSIRLIQPKLVNSYPTIRLTSPRPVTSYPLSPSDLPKHSVPYRPSSTFLLRSLQAKSNRLPLHPPALPSPHRLLCTHLPCTARPSPTRQVLSGPDNPYRFAPVLAYTPRLTVAERTYPTLIDGPTQNDSRLYYTHRPSFSRRALPRRIAPSQAISTSHVNSSPISPAQNDVPCLINPALVSPTCHVYSAHPISRLTDMAKSA